MLSQRNAAVYILEVIVPRIDIGCIDVDSKTTTTLIINRILSDCSGSHDFSFGDVVHNDVDANLTSDFCVL